MKKRPLNRKPCSSAWAGHQILSHFRNLSAWSPQLDSSCSKRMASIWLRGISKIFRVQDKVFSSGINSQCIQRAKLIADYIICSCHVKKWLEIGASCSQRENLRDRHFSLSAENETLLLIGSLSDRTLHPYLCFIRLFFIGQKSCNRGTWPFSASITDLPQRTNKQNLEEVENAMCFVWCGFFFLLFNKPVKWDSFFLRLRAKHEINRKWGQIWFPKILWNNIGIN